MIDKLKSLFEQVIHSCLLLSIREAFIALIPYFISLGIANILINGALYFNVLSPDDYLATLAIESVTAVQLLFPVMVAISVGFHYSKNLMHDGAVGAMLAALSFCVHGHYLQLESGSFQLNSTGSSAYAVIIPLLTSVGLNWFLKLVPRAIHNVAGVSEFLKSKFTLIFPFLFVFFGLFLIMPMINEIGAWLTQALSPDYANSSVAQLTFERMLTVHLFWFVGIHGDNMFDLLFDSGYLGQEIFAGLSAKLFYDTFVIVGGTGCFVGLIIAALFLNKDSHERSVAKFSIPFSIFNFCEIILFALPVFLNPILFIPFILAPALNFLISYAVISWGWVGYEQIEMSWMVPAIIDGYFVGSDANAMLLQGALILMNAALYFPFLRWSANQTNSGTAISSLAQKLNISQQYMARSEHRFIQQQWQSKRSTQALQHALQAISDGELLLYYQPQICLASGNVCGYEALLRIKDPQGVIKGPYFLDELIKHKQTELIDLWVIEQASKDLMCWHQQGFSPEISINLNPDVLTKAHLVEHLCKTFAGFNEQVKVEIIESSYLDQQEQVSTHIKKLKEHGITTVIDDFGTGYSSLFMLANLPVSHVKLDRQFLAQTQQPEGKLLYQEIAKIFGRMRYHVVAEGVETAEELSLVKELGIDVAQGWLYEKALPQQEILAYDSAAKQARC
ncbi:EAL domain-containing protein [Psychrobium sp. 1_MG-2023]|uniref:EAL domain-containing protein n=1 Tax=Psychrobium sp. 1_MG-2023 TaxID=3062624 RepID=UPI0026B095D1|nr:EAL domain-containing protein [Psychrobium sp. 1_MG-2023]MDP2561096.1 EAL domain-containing protein [Psychrobium sp. 1_MG-2023]